MNAPLPTRSPGASGTHPVVWARRLSQAGFLALFVYLFDLTARGMTTFNARVTLFFELDPLLLITVAAAAQAVTLVMLFSLLTLAVTVVAGRWFCGWVCPLGTVHNMVGALRSGGRKQRRLRSAHSRWQGSKYLVLVGLIGAAWAGANVAGWLDPMSFLFRALTTVVYPVVHNGASTLSGWIADVDPALGGMKLTHVSEPAYDFLRRHVLVASQPYFTGGAFLAVVLVAVLVLNLVRPRFWCRHLCPLGALLGVAGKNPLVRMQRNLEECTGCRACMEDCQGGAIREDGQAWKPAECFFCLNCVVDCPHSAVALAVNVPGNRGRLSAPLRWVVNFVAPPPGTRLDVGRRALVGASVVGVGAGLLASTGPLARGRTFSPDVIRPPGAVAEPDFLNLCVRCGQCMRACPTGAVQPAGLEAGWDGLWTPLLKMRMGYCEFECTACTLVCPTGALQALHPDQKKTVHLGTAWFDTDRCLPYAWGKDCVVCEEHCPLPRKAITLREATVVDAQGNKRVVKQPHVDPTRCIGCGTCENKCPLTDVPGVRVTSGGETRNPKNRALL